MFSVQDKRVVVTGGTRGIGEEIVRTFHGAGARVAILARSEDRLRELESELGDRVLGFATDVVDEGAVGSAIEKVVERWEGVDVLVNNAGVTRDKLLLQMKPEDWDAVMSINLKGAYLCSKAVLRSMLRQRAGRIVNITSVIGLMGNAGQANYAASKAGLIGYTKSLAKELASRSITVNAVAPGMIETDMTDALSDDQRKAILGQIPLSRLGSAADVAGVVAFLATDEAAYITGEVIRVDGGMAI